MNEVITIIGAGIGGLTTALALKKNGVKVEIYDGSAEIKPVGAGIIMANNAMQVFQYLSVQEKIEKAGNKISFMNITDAQLNNLSAINLSKYENKYSVYNVAIHRGDLQKILADEIGFENIHLSKRLTKIEKKDLFKLTFEDGTSIERKIVIGADGINSVVRNQLFKENTIRNTGQKCWRGICEINLPEKYSNEGIETWGKGKRFGFVRINSQKVYWYAVVNEALANEKSTDLNQLFKEFHPDILRIISETPANQIIFSYIEDLKPIEKWQDENICLIGDAAHATTPNLGQGACQAIEDAYTIGKLFEQGNAVNDVFSKYENLRKKKAHNVVNTSWTIGKVAQVENPIGIWVRNTLLKTTPASVNEKQLDKIFDISYI